MRWLAALLLMALLPVQGVAAAWAQVGVPVQAGEHDPAVHDVGGGHHCHDPADNDEGAPAADGKCCHAHAFMLEAPPVTPVVAPATVQPPHFVARWTSFIPEEPSPPPIASAA